MAITHLSRYADLVEYLNENNIPHRADAAAQLVSMPVAASPLGGLLHIRWEKKLPYVQIIHPFVVDVPDDRLHEAETAICRANNAIALPGLGFDYGNKLIYMRLCVPMYPEGMLATSFQQQVLAVINNAKDFAEAFRDIVAGQPGESVMVLALKHAREVQRA